jgi:phosphate transport system substrate-binding protein
MKIARCCMFALAFSLLVFAFISCTSDKDKAASNVVKLQGAGASFPAPLYTKWFKAYSTAHPDIQVDYQSVER